MGDAAETSKPKAKKSENPSTLDMVIEAVKISEERKGASVPHIKNYILTTYPTVDPTMLKSRLKKAFAKGLEQGTLTRPKGMEESGASLSGRFRVVKAKLAELEKPKKPKVAAKPKDKPSAKAKVVKPKKSPAKKAAAEKVKKAKALKSPTAKKTALKKKPPAEKATKAKKALNTPLKTPSKAKTAKAKTAKSKTAKGKAR